PVLEPRRSHDPILEQQETGERAADPALGAQRTEHRGEEQDSRERQESRVAPSHPIAIGRTGRSLKVSKPDSHPPAGGPRSGRTRSRRRPFPARADQRSGGRRSRGKPRPRSPMMLRWMFEAPPAIAGPSEYM